MGKSWTGVIERIETIRWEQQPHVLWVEIQTSTGHVGLGETFFNPEAVQAVVHEMAAPFLLGADAGDITGHWRAMFSHVNFYGTAGAEMRAISAIDMALWDILGKSTGLPVYALLGGRCRDRIPIYNTCVNGGRFRDQDGFLEDAGALAVGLIDSGVTAMKVWPWDRFAPQISAAMPGGPAGWSAMGPVGNYLPSTDLAAGLRVVQSIRDRVGMDMEVLIEGHSRWDLNSALRIARALEPYEILWMEDMMQPTDPGDLARLARGTRVPQAVSERLITRFPFRQAIQQGAAQVVIVDVAWAGGISEAKRIAELAEASQLPFAPHDCVGPVALFANLHLCASAPNAMILETVRGFINGGWYTEAIDRPIPIERGWGTFPEDPGLGVSLRSSLKTRSDVGMRVSAI